MRAAPSATDFGMARGVDLRRELAEHDDDDRQHEAGDRDRVRIPRPLGEDGGDRGGEHAGGREDHQIRAQPVVRLLQQRSSTLAVLWPCCARCFTR